MREKQIRETTFFFLISSVDKLNSIELQPIEGNMRTSLELQNKVIFG